MNTFWQPAGPSFAALERTVAPAQSPVSLAEAKAQLNVDFDDDDSLIDGMIGAALDLIDGDGVLGRALITQTWAQWVSQSPGRVRLRMGPFQSLVSVEYYDADGEIQTGDASAFQVRKAGDVVTIEPKANEAWPTAQNRPDAIKISYKAGFGDSPQDVPTGIRHAIFLLVTHWYENRSATSEKTLHDTPMAVDALLSRHRVGWYG